MSKRQPGSKIVGEEKGEEGRRGREQGCSCTKNSKHGPEGWSVEHEVGSGESGDYS